MIKHCLFPAAGYGTRFLPATKSTPKEMMLVVNKFKGKRFDCGSVEGYMDATNFCYHNIYLK